MSGDRPEVPDITTEDIVSDERTRVIRYLCRRAAKLRAAGDLLGRFSAARELELAACEIEDGRHGGDLNHRRQEEE